MGDSRQQGHQDPLKATLLDYLRRRRSDLAGTLDGLGEYDIRRPLVPSGTNLLGLVKHVASVQLEYFGDVFGRPSAIPMPWMNDDAEPEADMWATPAESRDDVLTLHRMSAEHSDATIEALSLDSAGQVPWWPQERRAVTLHQILVHVVAETAQHAGHADILRELIDGSIGRGAGDPNLGGLSAPARALHAQRVEAAAREASGRLD
ncbi:DinB family protein [Arthrobacter sp. B1805]|uniref:DinB family protein n=1 Tax=Arthrobacter sp. B1805 TaxID=2058892 RepID=UPI000CE45A2D|nr:DinB family protein [Arthrobacter sp. B1805]